MTEAAVVVKGERIKNGRPLTGLRLLPFPGIGERTVWTPRQHRRRGSLRKELYESPAVDGGTEEGRRGG
jgi:hypothetical protein